MGPQPPGAPGTSLSLRVIPGTQASGVASDQETEAKQRCWAKVSSCLAPVGGQLAFLRSGNTILGRQVMCPTPHM